VTYNPNYPVSADVLANPTALTNRDDAGFELHGVISRIQDILEALEAKVGIGASTPPATAAVLRRTATGASAWAQAQPGDLAAGGTANRLLATIDGATMAMTQLADGMVPVTALSVSKLVGGGTASRVLRTPDGTNALWGQVTGPDIAALAIAASHLSGGAVGQLPGIATGAQSTNSTTPVIIPASAIAWTSSAKPILVVATLRDVTITAPLIVTLNLYDGAVLTIQFAYESIPDNTTHRTITAVGYIANPGAGAKNYSLYWSVSAAQVGCQNVVFSILELH
jgi:hypothetical protein